MSIDFWMDRRIVLYFGVYLLSWDIPMIIDYWFGFDFWYDTKDRKYWFFGCCFLFLFALCAASLGFVEFFTSEMTAYRLIFVILQMILLFCSFFVPWKIRKSKRVFKKLSKNEFGYPEYKSAIYPCYWIIVLMIIIINEFLLSQYTFIIS